MSFRSRAIFKNKAGGDRVQGIISGEGARLFELARRRLALLARRKVGQVSDGDTIEYLARGEEETRKVLNGK